MPRNPFEDDECIYESDLVQVYLLDDPDTPVIVRDIPTGETMTWHCWLDHSDDIHDGLTDGEFDEIVRQCDEQAQEWFDDHHLPG